MNLAAAGLAHETRNPLNIIRGMAQMISKQNDTSPEIRENRTPSLNETDKVTAQLNEFINYSRPREVRRSNIALNSAVNEVVRTLTTTSRKRNCALRPAANRLPSKPTTNCLRQVLFNLLINAVQAVGVGGQIQILARHISVTEASLKFHDDGPACRPSAARKIFKPYFTTNQKGTGLGLPSSSKSFSRTAGKSNALRMSLKGPFSASLSESRRLTDFLRKNVERMTRFYGFPLSRCGGASEFHGMCRSPLLLKISFDSRLIRLDLPRGC